MTLKIALALMLGVTPAFAQQDCPLPTNITLGNGGSAAPCVVEQVDIPVYMNNPCAVGGFEIHIRPSDLSRFQFDFENPSTADTIGSRIGNWDFFFSRVTESNPSELIILGIADLPGGSPSVRLPAGDGLLFTAHLNFTITASSDTDLQVIVSFANVSDSTGYILYDVTSQGNLVHVQTSACDSNPRADCNCDGMRNGIDVIYLVGFLKGSEVTICGRCAGDANSSGAVNGIDVTFLVSYLKGIGAPPNPCD
jgi:hypothetical protein